MCVLLKSWCRILQCLFSYLQLKKRYSSICLALQLQLGLSALPMEEVCFVVTMTKLKLVEGTGSFLSCFHRSPKVFADLPAIPSGISAGVVVDSLGSILGKNLLLLLKNQDLDLDASHSKTSSRGRRYLFGCCLC
jgi:hypothetical protein